MEEDYNYVEENFYLRPTLLCINVHSSTQVVCWTCLTGINVMQFTMCSSLATALTRARNTGLSRTGKKNS